MSTSLPISITAARLGLVARQGQVSQAVCLSDYAWMRNSAQASPCQLAATVSGACASSGWTVPPLHGNDLYTPPNSSTANLCTCSWASYNLLMACTLCQNYPQSLVNWGVQNNAACNSYHSQTEYFPSNIPVPEGTLLPWYAAQNPASWTGQTFNLQDARSIVSQGHRDVTLGPQPNQSNPAPIGAIVGGSVGGVVILVIIVGVWIFLSRQRRKARKAAGSPIPSSPFDLPGHKRGVSDTSQTTIGNTFYQPMSSVLTTQNTGRPPTVLTHAESMSSHSYFGSVARSGTMYTTAPSSPPGDLMPSASLPSPTIPPVNLVPVGAHRENIIIPFTLTDSSAQQQPTSTNSYPSDRKRADGAIIPLYDHPNSLPSSVGATDGEMTRHDTLLSSRTRERFNPPAYSPYPGPSSTLLSSSPTSSNPVTLSHTRKGSEDTVSMNMMRLVNVTPPPTTHGVQSGGLSGLAAAIEQMGLTSAQRASLGLQPAGDQRNQMSRPVVGDAAMSNPP